MSNHTKVKPIIGIVGGIGSGKSTVANAFANLGCAVIDADKIGHNVLGIDTVIADLVDQFGDSILEDTNSLNPQISRKTLGSIVFDNNDKLEILNSIVRPKITDLMMHELEFYKSQDVPAIVLDAALLFEAGWDKLCTAMVFVDTPFEARLERVVHNRNWTKQMLIERELMQIPLDKKAQMCCYTLSNYTDTSTLFENAQLLYQQIIQL